VPNGLFIAVEGIDGSGTTTQTRLLANWLASLGLEVVSTGEPTKGEVGLLIRQLLRDSSVPAEVDALLFAADRALHTAITIKPALERGAVVISDRYVESSIAYQSSSGLAMEWVEDINRFALTPDLTIILDVEPSIGLGRKRSQRTGPLDKFENVAFLEGVRRTFLSRARERGFVIIDASRPIQEVHRQIRKIVEPLLARLK